MQYRLWMLIVLMLAVASAALTVENKLAGVRLGMKPKEVIDLLGDPTAYLMAQPPLAAEGAAGAANAALADVAPLPNTLIFLWGDQEIELGAGDSGTFAASSPGSGGGAPTASSTKLPLWAYTVQVAKLSLDQQELVYQINDTYSIGVTITGQGAEAKVTDVVACSFEPLKVSLSPATASTKLTAHPINFKYTKSKSSKVPRILTAGTSKKVFIGSTLEEVLKAHQWPALFLPFVTAKQGNITIDPISGKMVKDDPDAARVPDLAQTHFGVSVLDGMGAKLSLNCGTNCILLYPDEKLAMTLINFTVVRIQIGDGVRKPAAPRVALPSMPGH